MKVDPNHKPIMRPFLRWAGSKRQHIPKLSRYWKESYNTYIEPFMGSACLFFAMCPKKAILGDSNTQLVRTYLELRENIDGVWKCLGNHKRSKRTYYKLRSMKPDELSAPEAAARFIYLNRFCFNGLYRTNQKGQFNVPYAPSGTGSIPSKEHLVACASALQRAELRACDFSDTISLASKGDFVYLDPPFAVRKKRVFREYGPKVFANDDLFRLAESLYELNQKGSTFLVSYADCKEAREAFSGWTMTRIRIRRNIAGFSRNRRYAYELIASNMEPDN